MVHQQVRHPRNLTFICLCRQSQIGSCPCRQFFTMCCHFFVLQAGSTKATGDQPFSTRSLKTSTQQMAADGSSSGPATLPQSVVSSLVDALWEHMYPVRQASLAHHTTNAALLSAALDKQLQHGTSYLLWSIGTTDSYLSMRFTHQAREGATKLTPG